VILGDAAIVLAVAVVVAFGEFVARYQNTKDVFWRCRWFWYYPVLNGIVAAGALVLLRVAGPDVTQKSQQALRFTQLGAAGVGSLTVLRASSFASRVRAPVDPDPAASGVTRSTQAVLGYAVRRADLQVRDKLNDYLTEAARPYSTGWTFEDSGEEVATTCAGLIMLPQDEQDAFAARVREIRAMAVGSSAKTLLLARACVLFTNPQTLATAIQGLPKPAVPVPASPTPGRRAPTSTVRRARRPRLDAGLGAAGYSDADLAAMAQWVNSSRRFPTEDDAVAEVLRQLGFERRGPKITPRVLAAVASTRRRSRDK